ncbi:hypothetical protein WMY93_020583 [Mugilogobius chulae]|uniref:P-selectin glycoprotein ligand 1 n=1 Tax=Mugilogobius chulae TaxID=88201 RepID=A0AAW0NFD0_9GOBI
MPTSKATNVTPVVKNVTDETTRLPPKSHPTTAVYNTTIAEVSSTNSTTENATAGGLIPFVVTKTKTTEKKNSTDASTQKPCSTKDVVNTCLIAIASLAFVATVFMVCTIVLCTRLSGRRYRMKRQQGTEMTCISSLMRERPLNSPHRYTRQRSPVRNGVLVIHNCGDSDDEGGDNLTLSSFLPDNDRYI